MRRGFRASAWVRVALVVALLCILPPAARAERSAAGKPADESPSPGQLKTVNSAGDPVSTDADRSALQSFNTFVRQWMGMLAGAQEYQRREQIKVHKSGSVYVAEYTGYDRKPLWVGVKRTTSAMTPYVGRLFYHEWNFRCVAKSVKEALKGPFKPIQGQTVEEIFRFTGGKWIY